VLCFDTFRGFSHKIYTATMDGKGEDGTYNFFSTTTRGSRWAGHRAQGAAAPPLSRLFRGTAQTVTVRRTQARSALRAAEVSK